MLESKKLKLDDLGQLRIIIPQPEPKLKPASRRSRKIIPVCEPKLAGNELKYIMRCVKTNWISSTGEYIKKFEDKFARYCGTKFGISCTSGTTALHLALATLGISKNDQVIVPTFTMIATANAVTYLGARPVLVDSEPRTWNIDADKIEQKITVKTRAIMPIHTYGHPADMDKILEIAKRYNLYVVEDAAEAHGAEYHKRRVGGIGDIGCFSFYANKIITTGEGGMLTTNNKKIAEIARTLKNHAFSKERHFWHQYLGFNYRLTNLQAAIGLAQAERLDQLVETRIRNARYYNSLLGDIEGIRTPPETKGIKNVCWMYSILVEDAFGLTRDALRKYLAQRGIETRTFFVPIHLQPIYFKKYKERFPVAEELCRKGMYLPSAATLTKADIEYVARCIKSAQGRKER